MRRRNSMSRFASIVASAIAISLIAGLSACGGGNAVTSVEAAVPAGVLITPSNFASLQVGSTLTFTASAVDSKNNPIANETISYASNNQAVVTVAANGIACAGSWDSLTTPQICTPGQTGTAVVTAVSQGVSSPSTTVYVHQRIDHVEVSAAPGQPPPFSSSCFSKGQTYNYQAQAFNGSTDITSTVGPFTWQAASPAVVTLNAASDSNPVKGLIAGQAQATANVPGTTTIYGSAGGVNSAPFSYTTCAVKSITLAGNGGTGTVFNVPTGTTPKIIDATVFDTLDIQIYGIPLTWCTSLPTSVSVTGECTTNASSNTAQYGGTVSVSASAPGDGTVIATCTPPNCNIGFVPSMPIYPENVVNMTVTAANGGSGSSETATFYVSSTDCGTKSDCVSEVVPITASNNLTGTPIVLPATPNGLTIDRVGANLFLGTDFNNQNSQGLMLVGPSGSNAFRAQGVTGKVLAVSPDGATAIVSDTLNTPNQVFVVNVTGHTSITLQIAGATAASFSPDSLKAFIAAGDNLYIYSKLDALQTIPLTSAASSVSFLPIGAFALLTQSGPGTGFSTLSSYATCSDLPGSTLALASNTTPTIVLPLPNSTQVLVLNPPNVDTVDVTTMPIGCNPALSIALQTSTNLGQGIFTPSQMILSPDGTKAYIVSQSLNHIVVFDIIGQTTAALALAGNVTPIQAALAPDGIELFVAASDGTVHVVNTVAGGDVTQITFPQNLCQNTAGQPYSSTCRPNLITVMP
jgi:hypothetical protein